VEQLQLYKRFKEIGNLLHEREAKNLRTYLRLAPAPKMEAKLDLSDLSLEDLIEAAAVLMDREEDKEALATVISAPKITVREKISVIAEMLSKAHQTHFDDLLGEKPSRIEIVVTFLALLELVKRYRVATRQNELFADIEIERLQEWDADEELDIEFE
jgi:segregation and condensation protein A